MEDGKAGAATPAANGVQNNSGKSVKYRVDVDCYWNDIYWFEDEVIELPSDKKPPEVYFKKL